MRALFEDRIYSATSQATYCTIHEIYLPNDVRNRRDIWFRVVIAIDGSATVYAYATRDEAITTVPPSTYLASATGVQASGNPQSITLIDNPATSPDMTGLFIVRATLLNTTSIVNSVWPYTSAPHLLVCDTIRQILLDYTGTGRALSDFDLEAGSTGFAANHIAVGHPLQAQVFPFVAIRPRIWRQAPGFGTGSIQTRYYPIEVYVITGGMDDPFEEYRRNQEYLATIESILADERRTILGEALVLQRESGEDPDIVDYEGLRWQSRIDLVAELHAMWRDDTYPRQ